MGVHLKKAYKIIKPRYKKYEAHYSIPSENCLVVPLREFDSEVSCAVHWEISEGELGVLMNIVFLKDNLTPLNRLQDPKLHELFEHHYS